MKTTPDDYRDLGEEIALFRYGLIADVARMETGSKGIYAALREKAAKTYNIPGSSRSRVAKETMRTWLKAYRKRGFAGLYPKSRCDKGIPRKIPPEVVDQLVQLKEDSPKLTVKKVIAKVRAKGVPEEVILPESTVHRLLDRAGLMHKDAGASKDRLSFCYPNAGDLWMSDVMHGPALVRDGRRKRKTYLIAFIDDATRVISHAEFCWAENTAAFLPVFKKALLRRGVPLRLYVDNGAAYRSRQLELVCAKLGITLVHARPYQPQGKGKIERFFRTVRMQFLEDAKVKTLEEMNQRFWAWVEGEYHRTPHRGIDRDTPFDRWAQVAAKVKVLGPETNVDDLLLWEVKRRVRTDRTVSLHGRQYEVAAELVRQNVTLRYDPGARPGAALQVWHRGTRHPDAKPVDRHANCHVKRDGVDFSSIGKGE